MAKEKYDFGEIVDLIHSTKNKGLLQDFLLALTTPHEQRVMARRVEIVKRLVVGQTQHQIALDLKIGVSTVTRGQRELNLGRFKIMRNSKHTQRLK